MVIGYIGKGGITDGTRQNPNCIVEYKVTILPPHSIVVYYPEEETG